MVNCYVLLLINFIEKFSTCQTCRRGGPDMTRRNMWLIMIGLQDDPIWVIKIVKNASYIYLGHSRTSYLSNSWITFFGFSQ